MKSKFLSYSIPSLILIFSIILLYEVSNKLYNYLDVHHITISVIHTHTTPVQENEEIIPVQENSIELLKGKIEITNKGTVAEANKNPLNVTPASEPFVGQVGINGSFVEFSDFHYGIRAGAKVLMAYQNKHGINTVEKVIDRFCRASPQKKYHYSSFVANQLKVGIKQEISLKSHLPALLKAMAMYESGMIIPDEWLVGYSVVE